MRRSLCKLLIIGLCLLGLSGCSAWRVAYNQGPTLAWWWLDSYMDFNAEQAPRVKAALQQWFDWNRSTQLQDYAQLLADAQQQVLQPLTAAQLCAWNDSLRARVDTALNRALPLAAPLVASLTAEQLNHLEGKYRKANQKFEDDFLQPSPDERLKAALERSVERAEMLYGKVDEAQRQLLVAGLARSPFDAALWFAQRQAMQAETLRTLRALVAARASTDTALSALGELAQHMLRPQPPAYRTYQRQLADYNCALAARLHNSTSVSQRQAARAKLKAWEDDLRVLAAQPLAREL